ncbi:MAG: ABC transporter ATP-binding protein [Clostridia bacterium]|nr:ABC transporter ATP-binding protein [Clostridia bacterium]
MLEATGITCGYRDRAVLKEVSVSAEAGQVTALIGPNGSGKSTLLKALGNILPLSVGSIRLNGEDLTGLAPQQFAQRVAYLAQGRAVPDITVARMVLHGRFPYQGYPRKYRKEDREIANRAMELMGVAELADKPLAELSGGQRQKVYLAMALAQETDVLLLDEPTTYLDIRNQFKLLGHAKRLAAEGKHVLISIHDLTQALAVADRLILIEGGAVRFCGTPGEFDATDLAERVFGVRLGHIDEGGIRRRYYITD